MPCFLTATFKIPSDLTSVPCLLQTLTEYEFLTIATNETRMVSKVIRAADLFAQSDFICGHFMQAEDAPSHCMPRLITQCT